LPDQQPRHGRGEELEEHPLRRLYDAGVPIVLNTDDPAMFGCTLAGEYQLAARQFGFSEAEMRGIAENGFRYAFRKRGVGSRCDRIVDLRHLMQPLCCWAVARRFCAPRATTRCRCTAPKWSRPNAPWWSCTPTSTFEGSKTAVDGVRADEHALHETIEITQGFTPWFETGFYIL